MIIKFNNDFAIEVGNATDVGLVREKNEDYFESFESPFGYVSIVCDGMGGHTAGEIASRLAVSTIKEYMLSNSGSDSQVSQKIVNAIHFANQRIIDKWDEEPELKGMGTTIVLLVIKENTAYYAHVGDSRIYLVRNSKIYQITKDHSFVQTLIDGGLITYEEAENHPRKNEITQALGISDSIVVSINEIGLPLYKSDTFILCSDGLSGMVRDEDIQRIIIRNNPQEASMLLITTANKFGGQDNITVQVVKVVNGNQLPGQLKDVPPRNALDKNIKKIPTTRSGIKNFEKTSEIPSYIPGMENPKRKKNRAMIYLLLIFLIIIFGGLTYYVISKKDKTVDVSKNQIVKPEKTKVNVSIELKKILELDSLRNNGNNALVEIDSTVHQNFLTDKKKKKLESFFYQEIEPDSTKYKYNSGDYNVIVEGRFTPDKFKVEKIIISELSKEIKEDGESKSTDKKPKAKDEKEKKKTTNPKPKVQPKQKEENPGNNEPKKEKKLITPK